MVFAGDAPSGVAMTSNEREEQVTFQDETLRVARELWSQAEYAGAEVVGGRERDGIFETEDCIHLLECTVSRTREKADTDSKKLAELARKYQAKRSDKAVKCWFVTKEEPTADQRAVIKTNSIGKNSTVLITPISFSQFQAKLIDAATYLNLRDKYPFGSVRDPATGDYNANIEYIPLDVVEGDRLWDVDQICAALVAGERFVMFADYGSGKSMTLREVYKELRRLYFTKKTIRFPVYLNLRDHFGQTNPAEVLVRHGTNLGFGNPSHLVRAWRSGYVLLLIDGFDELTTLGIQGIWKKLQEIRYRAMEIVRRFGREQPRNTGIMLTGRAHFFDSDRERRNALAIGTDYHQLALNEFNDEQIKRYLDKRGLRANIPAWMPSRPLLVGYLAASGVLEQVFSGNEAVPFASDPAKGWDFVINRICAREAEIEAGIDGQTVRKILERLATRARRNQSGLGPISRDEIIAAFNDTCGYQPDEKGLVLLQRLPGLGIDRAEEGTRVFLDEDLADVCRAGDISAFLSDPFNMQLDIFRNLDCSLGDLGVGLTVVKAQESDFTNGKMIPALRVALQENDCAVLLLDLVRICLEFNYPIAVPVHLRGVLIPDLYLHAAMEDCSELTFSECLFSTLSLGVDLRPDILPRFTGCYIDVLEGRASRADLPAGLFDAQCVFGKFTDAPQTTAAISEMDLPVGTKVLLTILKKIYFQSGSGRKENALQRGLDHHGRRLVGDILRLLQTEKIISPYRRAGIDMTIWIPDRSKTARVQKLIMSPRTCKDSLIDKVERV